MKITRTSQIAACAVLVAAFNFAGGIANADDHHDAWSHDRDGYWDNHNTHHAFVMHENHHGYWRQRDDGTRVFINID